MSNLPERTAVKESESTYCDSSAGANLAFVANVDGLRFFLDRGTTDMYVAGVWLSLPFPRADSPVDTARNS